MLSLLLCLALPAMGADGGKPSTLRITAKSFAGSIDLSSIPSANHASAERAFAAAASGKRSENPAGPSPDNDDYRMWSEITVRVTCKGNSIASWDASRVAHQAGTQLPMLDAATSELEPLKVRTVPLQGNPPLDSVEFSYAIKGSPGDWAQASYRTVRPRTCDAIWHRVRATITCQQGKVALDGDVAGSRFPSHRVWTNGETMATLDEGPISGLWDCDPSHPELVR
jgi:hypothetical protein